MWETIIYSKKMKCISSHQSCSALKCLDASRLSAYHKSSRVYVTSSKPFPDLLQFLTVGFRPQCARQNFRQMPKAFNRKHQQLLAQAPFMNFLAITLSVPAVRYTYKIYIYICSVCVIEIFVLLLSTKISSMTAT